MPSIITGFEYDIFISYRHNDNRSGWVTEFTKALQEELASTIKEPVSIYFDANPHDGLLETHNVDKSLEGKLKCLIFLPILSQTYCDPKSFAWQYEFIAFNKLAKEDQFGRDIKLMGGNVASRILPIKIHDLDADDKATIENEIGSVLRSIEFIYKEAGVNRPLKSTDTKTDNQHKTDYRNQVNKVANAAKEIITSLKHPAALSLPPINSHKPTTNTSKSKSKLILVGTIILILVVAGYFLYPKFISRGEELAEIDKSIAVLPFTDLSPAHDQEYFGIGMMDEILNHLTKIGDLSPVSRTSSLIYGKSGKTAKEIANELEVANILEGSVSKSGNRLKITAQLIDAKTDRQLWSDTYEREVNDIFAIESEVAQSVAQALSARINLDVKKRIEIIPTKNQEAYDLFLKAHSKLSEEEDVIPILEKVIELDPNFSRAYSDLAFRWELKGYWAGTEDQQFVKNQMHKFLEKAIELDPNNSDAYQIKSNYNLFFEWNFDEALEDIKKAAALNPSRPDLGHSFQLALCQRGKFDESLEKSLNYFNLDKNVPSNWVGLGNSYFYAGQPKKAIETLEAAVKLLNKKYLSTENQIVVELGEKKVFAKDWKGALQVFEPISQGDYPLFNGYMGIAYAHLGQRSKAVELANRLHAKSKISPVGSPSYFAAAVHVALGENDKAIKWLEIAYKHHEVEMFWLKVVPIFEPLRKDQRFVSILNKVGFK